MKAHKYAIIISIIISVLSGWIAVCIQKLPDPSKDSDYLTHLNQETKAWRQALA